MNAISDVAAGTTEAPDERTLLRWLLKWALPHRRRIVAAIVLVLAGSAFQVAGPLLTAAAIDLYMKPQAATGAQHVLHFIQALHLPSSGGAGLMTVVGLYFASLLGSAVLLILQARTMLITGQLVMRDLRDALFAHLQRLEVAWFSRTPAGRVITRLTSDVEALNELFTSGLVDILADLSVLGGIAAILFALDWRLALVAFAVLPFMILLSGWFRGRARTIYREVRTRIAAINTHLQEHLAGMSVVQLARAEGRTSAAFKELDAKHRDVNIRGVFYYAVFYPMVELLIAAGMALLLVFGGVWKYAGTLSIGVLYAFLQYVQRFFRPIADLAENYNILQTSFAAAERLKGLLGTEPGIVQPVTPLAPPGRVGTFEFDAVWFAYEEENWVLRDIGFAARSGERLAVVGHTGAGKSTLVNLLLRFYDVQRGGVLVAGADVRRWDLAQLRRRFAAVLQEIDCFAGTLRENVSLGRRGVDDRRMRWALEQVGAATLLDRLPQGLDTVLGERGTGLSVGERQLVSFARALVGDPEFLLLDEATSSVDPLTEAVIQRALERLLAGRTALIIAHRLATVVGCDRVLVMHSGRLVEQGHHEELLARGGLYRALYELQLLRPTSEGERAAGLP
ncbi:MAG: ABC transporter ATP-binding protein/permease [Acidobacteriia bacterium]|nr:ABC transporter ATP-binding protein/permease [Terriglobia bacterium]